MLFFVIALVGASWFVTEAVAACDPTTATCAPNLGLPSSSYSIDFTQQSTLPANWTLANYENVTYGPNGAEFTFAKRYDAPYIWTDFYFLFGTVEVVMQAAPGTGIISSAVLISDDLDEIDWEVSGTNFGNPSGLAQTNYFGKGITGNYDRGTQVPVASPQTEFHTYTLDWTPTTLTWSIDGVVVRTLSNTGATSGDYQYPQSPMQLHLGLWDAGDADSAPGTVAWAGGYTELSAAPFTAYVKSVSITNANPCASYEYSDMSGSYESIQCGNGSAASSSGDAPTPVNANQVIAADGANTTTGGSVAGDASTMTATITAAPCTETLGAGPAGNGSYATTSTVYDEVCGCMKTIVYDEECGCVKTVVGTSATAAPANGTVPYSTPLLPTATGAGMPTSTDAPSSIVPAITGPSYTGAASRAIPMAGLLLLLPAALKFGPLI